MENEEYIRLGTLRKPFGLQGQVRCVSLTSFASLRFVPGKEIMLYAEKTKERKTVTVSYFRDGGNEFFLGFEGINTIEAIEPYMGWHLEMLKKDAMVPEGYYRLSDLIGMKAFDATTAEPIGEIIDVVAYSKTPNLKLKETNGKIAYIPFVMETFVKSLDLENKTIHIEVMPGLL